MSTPPLLLGSKFKVLSLIGLSCSGIVGSFSAIHKSADRVNETMDSVRGAMRTGMGHMFAGTSSMSGLAGEWAQFVGDNRFVVLSFIARNGNKLSNGQRGMVDQAREWGNTAREFLRNNLSDWWNMLPMLFYYWNRRRVTLFNGGISEEEIKDTLIQQLLEGFGENASEIAEAIMDNPIFKAMIGKLSGLVSEFNSNLEALGDNKSKAEKAIMEVFSSLGDTLQTTLSSLLDENSDTSKLAEGIQKLSKIKDEVGSKFKSNSLTDDASKKAQESTEKLFDWILSNTILPLFTDECGSDDQSSDNGNCAEVTVIDEEGQDD